MMTTLYNNKHLVQGPGRNDLGKQIVTAGGVIAGGTAGGLATSAAIAGTTIAATAAAPVVIIGAGVVTGATGIGWAASKLYSWIMG